MDLQRLKPVLTFLAVGGFAFFLASAVWNVYFVPSVPMDRDWCRDWVDLRGQDNPSGFSGCVEFKNDLEASKYYHNRRMIDRNKWWMYGCIAAGGVIAVALFCIRPKTKERFRHPRHLVLALVYGLLVATVIPRVYSAVLPAPYKWFPEFLKQAAMERQRDAALLVGVPEAEVDNLIESQFKE